MALTLKRDAVIGMDIDGKCSTPKGLDFEQGVDLRAAIHIAPVNRNEPMETQHHRILHAAEALLMNHWRHIGGDAPDTRRTMIYEAIEDVKDVLHKERDRPPATPPAYRPSWLETIISRMHTKPQFSGVQAAYRNLETLLGEALPRGEKRKVGDRHAWR